LPSPELKYFSAKDAKDAKIIDLYIQALLEREKDSLLTFLLLLAVERSRLPLFGSREARLLFLYLAAFSRIIPI